MGELLRFRKKEWNWKRTAKVVILLAFIIGILLANFMGREKVTGAGVLNDYFVEKFKYTEINRENLFFYIMGERMPMVILGLIFCFCSFGIIIGILNLGWLGLSFGFMLSAAVAKYGVRGILLIIGGMFPQYIFYLVTYVGYCSLAVFLGRGLHKVVPTGNISREQMRMYGMGLFVGGVLVLLFVTGIFLESYMNPIFLKKILKIF